jgi:hypothetical protein
MRALSSMNFEIAGTLWCGSSSSSATTRAGIDYPKRRRG